MATEKIDELRNIMGISNITLRDCPESGNLKKKKTLYTWYVVRINTERAWKSSTSEKYFW